MNKAGITRFGVTFQREMRGSRSACGGNQAAYTGGRSTVSLIGIIPRYLENLILVPVEELSVPPEARESGRGKKQGARGEERVARDKGAGRA
jgi:hypothetical protein